MFVIREDVYRKRELADRLKIAFATAASAGMGLGASWLFGGEIGILAYSLTSVYEYANVCRKEAASARVTPDLQTFYFSELKTKVDKISEQIGIRPPPIFCTSRLISKDNAYVDGPNVIMGSSFYQRVNDPGTLATVGHEIGHIKNKDSNTRRLLVSFSCATDTSAKFIALSSCATILGSCATTMFAEMKTADFFVQMASVPVFLFLQGRTLKGWQENFLFKKVCRIQEFRADRFSARVADCPLDHASELETHPSSYQFSSDAATSLDALLATHPPDSHRIRALVQLCKRVPDPPTPQNSL